MLCLLELFCILLFNILFLSFDLVLLSVGLGCFGFTVFDLAECVVRFCFVLVEFLVWFVCFLVILNVD